MGKSYPTRFPVWQAHSMPGCRVFFSLCLCTADFGHLGARFSLPLSSTDHSTLNIKIIRQKHDYREEGDTPIIIHSSRFHLSVPSHCQRDPNLGFELKNLMCASPCVVFDVRGTVFVLWCLPPFRCRLDARRKPISSQTQKASLCGTKEEGAIQLKLNVTISSRPSPVSTGNPMGNFLQEIV
jgi:hypothetical protein